jgi:phenylpropionate dioxygenase-like ring-hydroxylating dioxygenase large terminal subunit
MSGSPGFRREDCGLPQLRSQLWQGLIFFTCSPEADDIAVHLEATMSRIAPYRLPELKTAFAIEEVWNTNWKVAVENGSESYHHGGVHRQTLEPHFPTTGVRAEPGGLWHNMHTVPASADFSFDRVEADRPSATQLNPSLQSEQLRELLILGIYPNLVLAFAGACVTVFRFVPIHVAQTLVRATWLVPASYLQLENAGVVLERDRRTLQAIIAEDRASCVGVQVGLSCLDAPAAGLLAPIERPIREFGGYLRRRLCGD